MEGLSCLSGLISKEGGEATGDSEMGEEGNTGTSITIWFGDLSSSARSNFILFSARKSSMFITSLIFSSSSSSSSLSASRPMLDIEIGFSHNLGPEERNF